MMPLIRTFALALGALTFSATWAQTASGGSLEYRVKAAFLFNFALYTEWPASQFSDPTAPIDLCLLDPDPFHGALHGTVAGKQAQGRSLRVVVHSDLASLDGCEILYLDTLETARQQTMQGLVQAGTLIVTSDPRLLDRGGMIAFIVRDEKLRFLINLDAARTASLGISSKLLRVAEAVHRSGDTP